MKQYWKDWWLAEYGCTPDGLDIFIVILLILILMRLTDK